MKVLLYSEGLNLIKVSGLGRAILHQKRALTNVGVPFTTDPKDKDFDTVHINTLGLKSKHLAKKMHKQGKHVVYHAHSTEEDFRNSFVGSNLISGVFKKWIVSCYNSGDVIITPTNYSKRLIEGYGVKKPVFAISNGIDLDFYKPQKNDRKEFREQFGYTDDDKVVMSVGLYFERKGILDFVELAKAMPEYKFIWFGKTPLASVPTKVRKAVNTKLPNLTFAGYVQPDMLKKAYTGSDVYIFPTHEETEGIVLLEALAAHANVIVRDIPVFDWLEKDKDCYMAADNAEFEQKIRGIIEGTLPDLRDAGYEAVKDKNLTAVGEKLVEAYSCTVKN